MAARTYQPTLKRLAHTISVFIARYQTLLLQGMNPAQALALTAFMQALDDLITTLDTGGGV